MKEKLMKQYNIVFDKGGNVKACGRIECRELIRLCENYTGSLGKYGNADTGFMNVEEIKSLFATL